MSNPPEANIAPSQTAQPTSRATLTIRHTAADGTLLCGSSKGDGAWEAIKTAQRSYKIRGWKYFPSMRQIGVMHSRDRAPMLGLIDRTAEILREAGFDVEIDVDAAPRAMEESEADRAERMDDRADALAAKAARKSAEADTRWNAAQQIADGMNGQPILVGHHSERRHRRDMRRMDGHMRKSAELTGEAERAAHGAATAERHMDYREAPGVTHRRIERLEADRRDVQRKLDGYTRNHRNYDGQIYYQEVHEPAEGRWREELLGRAADLDEKIRYWKKVLDEHRAAGRWNPIDPKTIKKGDHIKYRRDWYLVVRVNKKTVSTKSLRAGDSWYEPKVPIAEISSHRRPDHTEPVNLDGTGQ